MFRKMNGIKRLLIVAFTAMVFIVSIPNITLAVGDGAGSPAGENSGNQIPGEGAGEGAGAGTGEGGGAGDTGTPTSPPTGGTGEIGTPTMPPADGLGLGAPPPAVPIGPTVATSYMGDLAVELQVSELPGSFLQFDATVIRLDPNPTTSYQNVVGNVWLVGSDSQSPLAQINFNSVLGNTNGMVTIPVPIWFQLLVGDDSEWPPRFNLTLSSASVDLSQVPLATTVLQVQNPADALPNPMNEGVGNYSVFFVNGCTEELLTGKVYTDTQIMVNHKKPEVVKSEIFIPQVSELLSINPTYGNFGVANVEPIKSVTSYKLPGVSGAEGEDLGPGILITITSSEAFAGSFTLSLKYAEGVTPNGEGSNKPFKIYMVGFGADGQPLPENDGAPAVLYSATEDNVFVTAVAQEDWVVDAGVTTYDDENGRTPKESTTLIDWNYKNALKASETSAAAPGTDGDKFNSTLNFAIHREIERDTTGRNANKTDDNYGRYYATTSDSLKPKLVITLPVGLVATGTTPTLSSTTYPGFGSPAQYVTNWDPTTGTFTIDVKVDDKGFVLEDTFKLDLVFSKSAFTQYEGSKGANLPAVDVAKSIEANAKLTYEWVHDPGNTLNNSKSLSPIIIGYDAVLVRPNVTITKNYSYMGKTSLYSGNVPTEFAPVKGEGIEFTLTQTKLGGRTEKKYITANGTVTFEKLEAGTYKISETSGIEGFATATDIFIEVKIVDGELVVYELANADAPTGTATSAFKAVNTATNWGRLEFTKYGEEFPDPYTGATKTTALPGAEFALYKGDIFEESVLVATRTTDENGKITFDPLETGVYYLEETKAPENYAPLNYAISITVASNTTAYASATDKLDRGTFRLKKQYVGANGTTLTDASGLSATFNILLNDRVTVATDSSGKPRTITVSGNDFTTYDGFLNAETYYLKEATITDAAGSPSQYTESVLDGDLLKVVIEAGKIATPTKADGSALSPEGFATNRSTYGELGIYKYNSKASTITDAQFVFELTWPDNTVTRATMTDADNGVLKLNVPAGKYKVSEVQEESPNYVLISPTNNVFEVDVASRTSATAPSFTLIVDEKRYDVENGVNSAWFMNGELGEIKVTKKDKATGEIVIRDVEFRLYEKIGDTDVASLTDATATIEGGVHNFSGLKPGEYYVFESKLDNSKYIWPAHQNNYAPNVLPATISTALNWPDGYAKKVVYDGNVHEITYENTPYSTVQLKKIDYKDDKSLIANATFKLYEGTATDRDELADDKLIGTMTSADTGDGVLFTINGENTKLHPGVYTLIETGVPSEYQIENGMLVFTVDDSGKLAADATLGGNIIANPASISQNAQTGRITVTFPNHKLPEVNFVKMGEYVGFKKEEVDNIVTDVRQKAVLGGAKFQVVASGTTAPLYFTGTSTTGIYTYATSADSNTTDTIISAKDGTLDLLNLPAGDYVLIETEAPATYTKASNTDFSIVLSGNKYVVKVNGQEVSDETKILNTLEIGKIRVEKHGLGTSSDGDTKWEVVEETNLMNGVYWVYHASGTDAPVYQNDNGEWIWDDAYRATYSDGRLVELITGTENEEGPFNTALSGWLPKGTYWVREETPPENALEPVYRSTGSDGVSFEEVPYKGIPVVVGDTIGEVHFYNEYMPGQGSGRVDYIRIQIEKQGKTANGTASPTDNGVLDDVVFWLYEATYTDGAWVKTGVPLATLTTGTMSKPDGSILHGNAITEFISTTNLTNTQDMENYHFVLVEDITTLPDLYKDSDYLSRTEFDVVVNIVKDRVEDTNAALTKKIIENITGKAQLTIKKYTKGTTTTLGDAVFGVYADAACAQAPLAVATITTASRSDGITFDLKPGIYYVKELKVPTNHLPTGTYKVGNATETDIINGIIGPIKLLGSTVSGTSAAVTLGVYNNRLPRLVVAKYAEDMDATGTPGKNVATATFALVGTESDGTTINRTGTGKTVTFDFLERGNYELTEVGLADGTRNTLNASLTDGKSIKFSVNDNGQIVFAPSVPTALSNQNLISLSKSNYTFTLNVVNPSKGRVSINKEFFDSENTKVAPTDVTVSFKVYLASETDEATRKSIGTIIKVNGKYEMYLDAGKYYLEEQDLGENSLSIKADSNRVFFEIADRKTTYVGNAVANGTGSDADKAYRPGNDETVVFKNNSENGKLRVYKAKYAPDGQETLITGTGNHAVFAVYASETDGTPIATSTTVQGIARFDLPAGDYWVEETQAPVGYVGMVGRQRVTVEANKAATVVGSPTHAATLTNAIIIWNYELTGIQVRKIATSTDSHPLDKTFGVNQTELELYKQNENETWISIATATTGFRGETNVNTAGFAEFTGLGVGKYRVVETNVPDLVYMNPDWEYDRIDSQDDAKTITIATSSTGLVVEYPKNSSHVGISEGIGNYLLIDNPFAGVHFSVQKVDTETATPLDGAMFSLYKGDVLPGTETPAATGTTADGGIVTFGPLELNRSSGALAETKFTVVETQAPNGYTLDPNVAPIRKVVTIMPVANGGFELLVDGVKISNGLTVPVVFHDPEQDSGVSPAVTKWIIDEGATKTDKAFTSPLIEGGVSVTYRLMVEPLNNTLPITGYSVIDDAMKFYGYGTTGEMTANKPDYTISNVSVQPAKFKEYDANGRIATETDDVYVKINNGSGSWEKLGSSGVSISTYIKGDLVVEYGRMGKNATVEPIVGAHFTPGYIDIVVDYPAYPDSNAKTAAEVATITNAFRIIGTHTDGELGTAGVSIATTSDITRVTFGKRELPVISIAKGVIDKKVAGYSPEDTVNYQIVISNANTTGADLVKPIVIDKMKKAELLNVKDVKVTYSSYTDGAENTELAPTLVSEGAYMYYVWAFEGNLAPGGSIIIEYTTQIAKILRFEGEEKTNLNNFAFLTSGADVLPSADNPSGARATPGDGHIKDNDTVYTATQNPGEYGTLNDVLNEAFKNGAAKDYGMYVGKDEDIQVIKSDGLFPMKGIGYSADPDEFNYSDTPLLYGRNEQVFYQLLLQNNMKAVLNTIEFEDVLPVINDGRETTWSDIYLNPVFDKIEVYKDAGAGRERITDAVEITPIGNTDGKVPTGLKVSFKNTTMETDTLLEVIVPCDITQLNGDPISDDQVYANTKTLAINDFMASAEVGESGRSVDVKSKKVVAKIEPWTGAVGTEVWYDANDDGERNNGEAGVPNIEVTLWVVEDGSERIATYADTIYDEKDFSATIMTDENGEYLFDGLKPGTYFVKFDKSTAERKYYWAKYTGNGKDKFTQATYTDAADQYATSLSVTMVYGDENSPIVYLDHAVVDYNNYLGDYVWFEELDTGEQKMDESDIGLNGVRVELWKVGAATYTDATFTDFGSNADDSNSVPRNGYYEFRNMTPGEYEVRVYLPKPEDLITQNPPIEVSNLRFSKENATTGVGAGDDSDATNINSTVRASATEAWTNQITVGAATTDATWDFAITRNLNNIIGDRVWFDKNGNGEQDTDERGFNGLTVELWRDGVGTASDTLVASTTTADRIISHYTNETIHGSGDEGYYYFEDLMPGDYYIVFQRPDDGVRPVGWSDADVTRNFKDITSSLYFEWTTTSSDPNPMNGETDSDAKGLVNATSTQAKTEIFSIPIEDDFTDFDIDAGVRLRTALGDVVWFDNDRNGRQNEGGQYAVQGMLVRLYSVDNGVRSSQPIATRVTDRDGWYLFDNLDAGDYQVEFVRAQSPYAGSNYLFTDRYVSASNRLWEEADSNADANGWSDTIDLDYTWNLTIDAGIRAITPDIPFIPNTPNFPNFPSYTPPLDPVPYGLITPDEEVPYGVMKTGQGIGDLVTFMMLGSMLMALGFAMMFGKKERKQV